MALPLCISGFAVTVGEVFRDVTVMITMPLAPITFLGIDMDLLLRLHSSLAEAVLRSVPCLGAFLAAYRGGFVPLLQRWVVFRGVTLSFT